MMIYFKRRIDKIKYNLWDVLIFPWEKLKFPSWCGRLNITRKNVDVYMETIPVGRAKKEGNY